MLELTPVEFACETMCNVEKELQDLIVQYKAEPNRNINPFSMRLQGIIDANVMGGISKYQEAFFTEQFARSADGNQHSHVHRLKCLILDQVLVLETALELHGQLAPVGVQPLHSRLLERFAQLKESLASMGKWAKRPHSDSIVNTPLPPLPTEKRTVSLEHTQRFYEKDDIYTKPMDAAADSAAATHQHQLREGLLPLNIKKQQDQVYPAPPIPVRPKSTCYGSVSESPEIPPKVTKAPPLPPRGYTPDKRASNPMLFDFEAAATTTSSGPSLPRRSAKYSVVNISLDDDVEADRGDIGPPTGFCDEESITSPPSNDLLNNLNRSLSNGNAASSMTMLQQHTNSINNNNNSQMRGKVDMNIPTNEMAVAPPIPPKTNNVCAGGSTSAAALQLNGGFDDYGPTMEDIRRQESGGGSGDDGYCVPKEVADSENV